MEIFLVGGAVRDELLGLPVGERDWVVVGSTPAELIDLGYRQVGRDFPVFLHPETGEEYALARTERKTGPGHTGFVVHADDSVTLEDDLIRRDLTINAMAKAADGTLFDPYNGRADLAARVLRHVSPAFAEDPLRVFRVARFAARLPDFEVAEETLALMRQMSAAGELDELSAERVWAEFAKALAASAPERFLKVLEQVDCLVPWFVEFSGQPLPRLTGIEDPDQRYAALVGSLPVAAVEALNLRLKAPRHPARLAGLVAQYGVLLSQWRDQPAEALYAALGAARAFKKDSHLAELAAVVAAIHGTALDELLTLVADVQRTVQVEALIAAGHKGAALGAALDDARIARLSTALAAR